jgi:hypothetical protein
MVIEPVVKEALRLAVSMSWVSILVVDRPISILGSLKDFGSLLSRWIILHSSRPYAPKEDC